MALSTILLAGLPLQSTIQSAPFDEANLYQMAEVLLIKCWAPTKTHLSMVPPLGLMYLASFLRELGHSVRLTRWNDVQEATARIHALIRERKPDVIGISAIVPECGTLRELMPKLQEIAPGVPVMVGGHLASANPLTTLRIPGVSVIALREGERTAAELVEALASGRDPEGIPGSAVLRDDKVVLAPERENLSTAELDELPFPAWDLLDFKELFSHRSMASVGIRPYMQVITSRGCPYRCIYCHATMGRIYRPRSPEKVIEEIRILREQYDIHEFEIVDDCFNLDRERMHRILDGLVAFGDPKLRLQFPNGLRSDLLTREDVLLLKKAGTNFISFAVETASPRLQKYVRKNLDIDKAVNAISMAAGAGIFCNGFFMLGFPTETAQEAKATIRLAVSTRLHEAMFFKVNPFRGTELFDRAVEEAHCNVDGIDLNDLDFFTVSNNISQMSDEEFEKIYTSAYRRFYLNPVRIARILWHHPRRSQLFMYMLQVVYKTGTALLEWARRARVNSV